MQARHSITVAVVGAGASGALSALHLVRRADAASTRLDVRLVDPEPTTGRGVAYRTRDPLHLLNVPASKMGAVVDDPDHFHRWLQRTKGVRNPDAYVQREWFGEYVEASLVESVARSRSSVERINATVTEIHRRDVDSTVRLADGRRFRASHVVLALGSPSGPNQLLPSSLLGSPRFISDPWAPGALNGVAASEGDVVLLGGGLTAVDVALRISRSCRTVTALSRRGLVPRRHASGTTQPVDPPPIPSGPISLEELQVLLARHVEHVTRSGRCWQDAVDSVRPVTNELWKRLSSGDQERCLVGPMRAWEVARHRMAPDVADRFRHLVRTGAVVLATGEVADAVESSDGIELHLNDGTRLRASSVISCTGATTVRSSVGPLGDLVSNLEHAGTVVLHPLGTGLVVDEVGRACTANGDVFPPIYVVGPLRRGALWETTAIPEIVAQSDEVARHIVAHSPARRLHRYEDLYGQALTTSGSAADLFNEALGRLLRVQSGALEALERSVEADPAFAVGHAALAMMGHEFDLSVDVSQHLDLALHCSSSGTTSRERSFVHAIRRKIDGDASSLIRHIEKSERDVLAISVAMPTIAFSGAYEVASDAWDLLERVAPHFDHDWWFDGLLAFARQEQGRFEEAGVLAERSLVLEPRGGNAAHAAAHVYFETGEHRTGIGWLDPWMATSGRDAIHLAHFSWHAALFELALGDTEAVVARIRSQLAPSVVRGTRLMVDTATILWRLLIEDGISPIETEALRDAAGEELWSPSTPFSAMHAVITWAVIGDIEELYRLERRCRRSDSVPIAVLVTPLATALRLYLTGRHDDAASILVSLLPNLVPLGGSAAQRGIVEDTAVAALVRAGDGALAASLLDRRLDRRARPKDLVIKARARSRDRAISSGRI